jgi:autotransporter-associated beta strand protein
LCGNDPGFSAQRFSKFEDDPSQKSLTDASMNFRFIVFPIRVAAVLALLRGTGLSLVMAASPPGYYLVWGDEFNEPSLNTTNWDYWVLGKFDSEIDVTNAVSMNGSNLVITTYTSNNVTYSALIASDYHFRPRYGYYEASIQWGDTNGMCSAWLRSPSMGARVADAFASGGELDICEHRYQGVTSNYVADIVSDNIHWDGYGAYEESAGSDNLGSNLFGQSFNLTNGFHLYGLNWSSNGTYGFYIDGTNMWNGTPAPLFGSDSYIIFSAEVNNPPPAWDGSEPPGGYPSLATSPLKLKIDYFHYYAPTNVLFWTGAASASWTNSANWVSNMLPAAGCDLTFSYLSVNLNNMVPGPYSIDGLIFLETTDSASIGGTNTLTLGAGGIDMVSACDNVTLSAPLNLTANQKWSVGPNSPGNSLTVNANVSGSATLTKASYGTLILNGTNSFSGTLNVDTGGNNTNDGALCIANSAAVANVASPISIRDTGMSVSTLQLNGSAGSVTVPQTISIAGRNTNVAAIENLSGVNTISGGITLSAGGSTYLLQADAGTLTLGGSVAASNTVTGTPTITFQGGGDFFVSGSIQNGHASALSVAMTGSGTLTLSSTNMYSGSTTVSSGTLAGNGSVASAATIQSGGTISPGGTLAFGGNLNLMPGSITFLHINKAAQTNDQLQTAGALTYGGTLIVTNLSGTPASGDTFQLFNAASYSGNFTGLILPPLAGLAWNTNSLTNGVLSVVPAAPQVTSDLPLQVTQVSGQSYTYFVRVNATPPFGYQWYVGATALPGQTNSSYSLTAASPGAYSYQVVITNAYGVTTSSVSILTVLGWPSTAYAAAVRALQPVGYWPLQETNAPAPATVETNLGSLGPTGNAYYPSTNSPSVTLGVPGALAGTPDTAVAFSSTGQPYAFVPRASPALTLEPPFTLEAWFNPLTTVYGVILGEGGGASLNGGPTYGGFQFGWAGGSETRFELQMYHYGNNAYTVLDSPTGYTVGNWYHYVVTFDTSSNATIYVNGQSVAGGVLGYVADTWSPLLIGNGKWNGLAGQRGVNGTIDEVAVYTNLLTPSDISAHYTAGISQAPPIPYKQMVLNDHPQLYYRMDNPAYTTPGSASAPTAVNYGSAPVEGAYLSGTVPAGVPGPTDLGWGPNPVASPINGIFSCIDAGYDSTFNPTNNQPFTALLWFKGNPADSSMQALMGHGAASWSLDLNGATGELIWNCGAGSATSADIYNDGAWHQAAGVYNGANNYLYVDGSLVASSAANGEIAGNTDHVYLGGDPAYTNVGVNERYFAGAIAQAAIFTNALTLSQILTTYQAAVAPSLPTLSISNLSSSQVELKWNYGILQCASNASGPYQDIPNATSPSIIPTTNTQQFYRVREY